MKPFEGLDKFEEDKNKVLKEASKKIAPKLMKVAIVQNIALYLYS